VLAALLPLPHSLGRTTILLNLAIFASYALLVFADSLRGRLFLAVMRDWFPLALMLLAYREMGWFAPAHHTPRLENIWIVWDRLLLERWGVRGAIEALGPVLPSILEIAYALVYAVGPFSVAMLYVYGRRARVGRFLFLFMLGVLLCYVQFPLWPSEPPRTVFPGQDFPSYETVFRKFNWWLLGGYGIHTSVFPSAHVAGAFSAAFGALRGLPEKPWVGRFLAVLAVLIGTATVYGRYHYFADAMAGLAMSLAALAISRTLQ
jgi:membrane-associated phospholipid phosphatase